MQQSCAADVTSRRVIARSSHARKQICPSQFECDIFSLHPAHMRWAWATCLIHMLCTFADMQNRRTDRQTDGRTDRQTDSQPASQAARRQAGKQERLALLLESQGPQQYACIWQWEEPPCIQCAARCGCSGPGPIHQPGAVPGSCDHQR